MAEKITIPSFSVKNWWVLRNQFKKSLPKFVTQEYLKTLLGYSTTKSAYDNAFRPLKALKLVDDEGKPTNLANDWRDDEKYKSACKTMLEIYDSELLSLFPLDDVDEEKVRSYFASKYKLGAGTARVYASFFVLLKKGIVNNEIVEKGNSKSEKKRIAKRNDPDTIQKATPPLKESSASATEKSVEIPTISDVSTSIHVDLQIHISPESSPEQIEKIFESIAKHIYRNK